MCPRVLILMFENCFRTITKWSRPLPDHYHFHLSSNATFLCDPDLDLLCIRSISKVALVNAGLIWIDVCPFDVHVHSKGFCYSAFCIFDAHFSCLLLKVLNKIQIYSLCCMLARVSLRKEGDLTRFPDFEI